jgi:chemotaxis protein methyltransferase CheR
VEIPIINPKKAIKILKQETFRILRDIIYANSGIFFPENKLYLLEGRLNKRLEEIGLDSFEDYVIYLKKGSVQAEELKKVYNLITINETYFFRHEKQLYAFEKKILPEVMELRKKEGKRNLRVWSAAASSGEESYTLAILMKETLNGQMGNWQVEITGTDISQKILAKAREGIFGKNSFRSNMVNYAQYQNKYFLPQGENLAVRDEIKKLVNFDFLI